MRGSAWQQDRRAEFSGSLPFKSKPMASRRTPKRFALSCDALRGGRAMAVLGSGPLVVAERGGGFGTPPEREETGGGAGRAEEAGVKAAAGAAHEEPGGFVTGGF